MCIVKTISSQEAASFSAPSGSEASFDKRDNAAVEMCQGK